jgi:diamine N-acetyltransferase
MIDAKHQQRGYGKAALELLIQSIWSDPEASRIFVSYKVENTVARRLYEAFGFVELGLDENIAEMVALLMRPTQPGRRSGSAALPD